jgi:Tol biopolymer transport system component
LTSKEKQGHLASMPPGISADGRFVAFATRSRLVRGDTNNKQDVYVRDRQTGITRRVSIGNHGAHGNSDSGQSWVGRPSLTPHAGTVAFASSATNLVHADHNGVLDVFVRTPAGLTQRVSISSAETGADAESRKPVISANGRYVAFDSEATNLVAGAVGLEVYVRDRIEGTTELVSVGNDGSLLAGSDPAMSADGRYVAFGAQLPTRDVYMRDRLTGTTSLVSTDDSGTPGNSMSIYPAIAAEGHQVAFPSDATNLVPGDANGVRDVFIRHTSDSGQ